MKIKADSSALAWIMIVCLAVVPLANIGVTNYEIKSHQELIASESQIQNSSNNIERRTQYSALITKSAETEERIYEVDDIEAISTEDSNKMGAKTFIEKIINGSFIKDVLGTNEVVEESSTVISGDNSIIETSNESGEQVSGESNEQAEVIPDQSGEVIEEIVEETPIEEVQPELIPGLPTIEINGETIQYDHYVDIYRVNGKGGASAYCLCQKCCNKAPSSPGYGRTASGLVIVPGTGMKVLSVDPSVIPLGTKVYVQGLNGAPDYGYAIAADKGGAIKGKRVDLYFDSHSDALKWGRKDVRVYLLP